MRRLLKAVSFTLILTFSSSSYAFLPPGAYKGWHENKFLNAATSPLGFAVVGSVGGTLLTAGTVVWSLNYKKRFNFTDEENADTQEAGGLTCAVVTAVFTMLAPLYLALYVRDRDKMRDLEAHGALPHVGPLPSHDVVVNIGGGPQVQPAPLDPNRDPLEGLI